MGADGITAILQTRAWLRWVLPMSTTGMNDWVQRLWTIERAGGHSPSSDASRFTGAIAIVNDSGTYVVLIRSSHAHGASEAALAGGLIRFNLERDAFRFASLDEALEWAHATKEMWTHRGWLDVADDGPARFSPVEHERIHGDD